MPEKFKPYVSPESSLPELTIRAVVLGIIMSVILGAANIYLGLVAGMTVAATFPAAVIAMAVLRAFKGSILEENIARTTGAVGEALAAGAIFTIPAFIITGYWKDFNYFYCTAIMVVGGLLGVFFIIILRKAFVEDTTLPFPESIACAEIVKAGQKGGTGAAYVFLSMGLGALVEFFKNPDGLSIVKPYIKFIVNIPKANIVFQYGDTVKESLSIGYEGKMFIESPMSSAALTGVGYIIGPRLASITFSGGVFGWLFLMTLMLLINPDLAKLADMLKGDWTATASIAYAAIIKPLAVGAMLVGAFYTLYKMRNNLFAGIRRAITDLKKLKGEKGEEVQVSRVDKDMSFGKVAIALVIIIIAMIFLYQMFTGSFGNAIILAVIMAFTGLLFSAVAGYLVSIIGSSSNPISGITLTTLIIAAVIMVLIGARGPEGVIGVLGVAAVVCCVAGVAGDMIQDWKVGYLLGGTPWKMQIGGIFGVLAAAFTLTIPIILLHKFGGGIGGERLPAPQAGLMAMMSQGIVGGQLAWSLVIAGMLFAIALILIGSPSPMLIAVGMYLPFHSTACIFFGGVVKFILDRMARKKLPGEDDPTKKKKEHMENVGILIASGLVAGEALTGVLTAGLKALNLNLAKSLGIAGTGLHNNPYMAIPIFLILAFVLIYYPYKTILKKTVE